MGQVSQIRGYTFYGFPLFYFDPDFNYCMTD